MKIKIFETEKIKINGKPFSVVILKEEKKNSPTFFNLEFDEQALEQFSKKISPERYNKIFCSEDSARFFADELINEVKNFEK